MLSMENWATQAVEKLKKERHNVSGSKEKAMADAVMEALRSFCTQEPEFAQAIVQGSTFADCMKKVAAGTGNCISDLDAYKKAVQFYFPGAEISMQMTINLIGEADVQPNVTAPEIEKEHDLPDVEAEEPTNSRIITLDMSDFF